MPGHITSNTPSDRRARVSAQGHADAGDRHRSLKAAIDWTYGMLSPNLQRFFCSLSIFRGGWTLDAVRDVCEEPRALDLLEELHETSLVQVDETELGSRFRMLETF